MLSVRLDHVIQQLVQQEMISKSSGFPGVREEVVQAMYFRLRLHLYSVNNADTFGAARHLHLLYYCAGGSSIDVFSAVTESWTQGRPKENWKHEISHDSCWRDIRVFSECYFEMAKQINEERVAAGLKEEAPKNMVEHNTFSGDTVWEWQAVRIAKDPKDIHNYRKTVQLVSPGAVLQPFKAP